MSNRYILIAAKIDSNIFTDHDIAVVHFIYKQLMQELDKQECIIHPARIVRIVLSSVFVNLTVVFN